MLLLKLGKPSFHLIMMTWRCLWWTEVGLQAYGRGGQNSQISLKKKEEKRFFYLSC